MDDKGRTHFRQAFREAFEGDPAKSGIYKDVTSGIASAGIEYYLPLFFDATATLFDYLPKDAVFVTHGDAPAIAAFWRTPARATTCCKATRPGPCCRRTSFFSDEAFFTAAKSYGRVVFSAKSETPAASALPDIAVDRRADDPLGKLKNHLAGFPGRVLLLAESAGRRETLATMLRRTRPEASRQRRFRRLCRRCAPGAGVGPLHFAAPGRPFITETELYAGSPRRTRREAARKASFDNWLKDLTELKIGDPVVP
jgi:transcription-repair coupling factor (superfamily II helicase)